METFIQLLDIILGLFLIFILGSVAFNISQESGDDGALFKLELEGAEVYETRIKDLEGRVNRLEHTAQESKESAA